MQKIAATGEQLKNVGGNIESTGKKLLPVTATVTALGTASVKTAADFEAAKSKVAAVSGASASEMEALTEKAGEMGSKTKFSASEAAEAMNYMAMAGWKTEDMLSGIEGVMNLAAASGEDLATTSDIVTDALTFLKAKRILNEGKAQDDIEWAMCKYLRIVLSYNGMGEFYQPYLGRYFTSMIEQKFPAVTERYQGVDIRCQDGVELIREAKDKEDVFVFADPPYLLNLRGNKKIYDNEMGEKEHIQMLEYMQEAKCKIMLCGYYDSEKKGGDLYDRLLEYGWKRYKLADLVQSCSNQKKKGIGEEFIWVNYELPPQARFYIRMSTEVSKANKN